MSLYTRLASLWRNLTRRTDVEHALDEELASHIDLLAAEKEREGMNPADARRAALLEIGGVAQVREEVRRVRTGALLDLLRSDLRYAMRSLARSPGFTLTAVTCLALGIGANTAVFSVVDTILHPHFGFTASDELVVLRSSRPTYGIPRQNVSYPDFAAWRAQSTSFTSMAALDTRAVTLMAGEEFAHERVGAISWNLFPLLGVTPALGRGFRQEEDRRGAPETVLLGHDLWTQRFNADSALIGRSILINGAPHTVIGVMPPRFRFPENTALWIPLGLVANDSARGTRSLSIFARLAPGMTHERATSELRTIAGRLADEYPDTNTGWTAGITPLMDHLGSEEGLLAAFAMLGAVTFLLLIACTNVANLLLARGMARRREIAIRSALGAGRGRMVGMLLVESLTLAALGGALGIAVAATALRMLDIALPDSSVPYYIDWHIDTRALVYMSAVALGTALAFGLGPALLVAGGDLQHPLKEGGRETGIGRRPARFRTSLVVIEVALSLILVVAAALFARTSVNLANSDPGFDADPMLNVQLNLPGERYATEPARTQLVTELLARIDGLPGVTAAAASSAGTIAGGFYGGGTAETVPQTSAAPVPDIRWNPVTSRWFEMLDVPLIRGRAFTDAEATTRSTVAIVSQSTAVRVWPNENPVGRKFRFPGDTTLPVFTVVGVTPDVRGVRPKARPYAHVFLPYAYGTPRTVSVSIRTSTDPLQLVQGVRRTIREIDPSLPVLSVQTMREMKRLENAETRVLGGVFSAFGLIALCLAATGVYGVISYGVTQRTHEIGVRMALGARRGDVLRMFVRQGLRLAVLGIAIGLAGTYAVTRVIRSMLFGVSATDPASFVAGAGLLLLVAAGATWIPAWRAARRDPALVLRAE